MPTFANTTPIAVKDGVVYASSVPLTSSEADVYNGSALDGQDPVSIVYGQAIVVIVKFVVGGSIVGNSSYIVMQTDLGDGNWIDVAWCFSNINQGSESHVLCGGGVGSINNAFRQSRQSGAVPTPQADGSNAMPLGGRVRFVGKGVMTGGSSGAPGSAAQVAVTVTYKLLGLN